MTYARLQEGPERAIAAAMSGRASGVAVRTSGTTGHPREVYLSTAAMRAAAKATHARLQGPGQWVLTTGADRIGGAMVWVRSIVAGTQPVCMPPGTFTAERFANVTESVNGSGPRYVSLVPTQLKRVMASQVGRDALRTYDTVLVGGAAPLSTSLPCNVVESYGMTETSGGCVYDGLPLDGVDIEIDADGHIMIAGPMLADGYSNGDDEPWSTRDGKRWLRTQDLGHMTAGRLMILGRADSVINTGGHKVNPVRVENAIASLFDGVEVAVVPVDDPEWGQKVVAVVGVIDSEVTVTLEKMRDLLEPMVEKYEIPQSVVVVSSLPRVSSGKIDRAAARQLAAS